MPLPAYSAPPPQGVRDLPSAARKAPLILVADDQPLLLELVQHRLEMEGYRVITANDGGEALELTATDRPDLLVIDNLMPVADGLEVLRRLGQDAELSQIPVLMLTGVGADTHAVAAFKLGAMDFLSKPFLTDELVARVQRLAPIQTISEA